MVRAAPRRSGSTSHRPVSMRWPYISTSVAAAAGTHTEYRFPTQPWRKTHRRGGGGAAGGRCKHTGVEGLAWGAGATPPTQATGVFPPRHRPPLTHRHTTRADILHALTPTQCVHPLGKPPRNRHADRTSRALRCSSLRSSFSSYSENESEFRDRELWVTSSGRSRRVIMATRLAAGANGMLGEGEGGGGGGPGGEKKGEHMYRQQRCCPLGHVCVCRCQERGGPASRTEQGQLEGCGPRPSSQGSPTLLRWALATRPHGHTVSREEK
jgi:hypothetical protein